MELNIESQKQQFLIICRRHSMTTTQRNRREEIYFVRVIFIL